MFGFGRSALEKGAIQLFSKEFLTMGFPEGQATAHATSLVDEVMKELKARKWNPLWSQRGDEVIGVEEFMAPRLRAGLTVEDVKTFWNRPLLVVYCDMKVTEKVIVRVAESAHAAGQDVKEAINQWARDTVRFGTPEPRDGTLEKANRPHDTMIYPEFSLRVHAWFRRTTAEQRDQQKAQHGTMNAAVRELIASGQI